MAASANALPLDAARTLKVRDALNGLTSDQLQWISGYAAGLAAAQGTFPSATILPATEPGNTLTILYGSQTGNGRGVAEQLGRSASNRGFAVNLVSLADYKAANIKRESFVTFVISTHGEGDPPDDAELFHEFLFSEKAPRLKDLKFSVLALGDSSYVNFCQTGREFDSRLEALGAQRVLPLVECDLDFDDAASRWSENVLRALPKQLEARTGVPRLHAVKAPATDNKHRPFEAEVLTNQKITGAKSSKDVRHIELSLEGSGLHYEPGDSLAVMADNPPQLIEQLLATLRFSGNEQVTIKDTTIPIAEALRAELEITTPSLGFLKAYAELANSDELQQLRRSERQLAEVVATRQIIDIVRDYPATPTPAEFAASLRKLMPRSYSIASSPLANPDEAHLTVAAVKYQAFGTQHWGAASTMLADRIIEGDKVSVFIESNPRFRLPADGRTPIIMIGPGTGVAPFRAFVEQRAELGATGKNWLFFGDRTFHSDFLYQLEWQRFLRRGILHRMDVAFSRDRADKIYVQHRILENAADIWRWLQQGAAVYVCGDAKQMASNVHDALIDVLVAEAAYDSESAENYLKDLRRADRYQRDVY
jgi:sulfite reductase (NADPH) flavoprotein alpha-component